MPAHYSPRIRPFNAYSSVFATFLVRYYSDRLGRRDGVI